MDPDNSGLEFWKAGLPVNDSRSTFYEMRLKCYDLALDSLNVFESQKSPRRDANPALRDSGSQEAIQVLAYQLALASEDELFHSAFYDWLINEGLADELLEV
jgi:nuclear pore complex protein Nup155